MDIDLSQALNSVCFFTKNHNSFFKGVGKIGHESSATKYEYNKICLQIQYSDGIKHYIDWSKASSIK